MHLFIYFLFLSTNFLLSLQANIHSLLLWNIKNVQRKHFSVVNVAAMPAMDGCSFEFVAFILLPSWWQWCPTKFQRILYGHVVWHSRCGNKACLHSRIICSFEPKSLKQIVYVCDGWNLRDSERVQWNVWPDGDSNAEGEWNCINVRLNFQWKVLTMMMICQQWMLNRSLDSIRICVFLFYYYYYFHVLWWSCRDKPFGIFINESCVQRSVTSMNKRREISLRIVPDV